MARKFNSNGIADGTLPGTKISSGSISASLVGSVRISSISITDNSYVVLDDTAVILTGGYIIITGTGFVSGCSVAIDTTIATSVSFVSATQLNVQVPAKAAGTYNIYLTTPTGAVAIRVNAITYSSTPTWVSTSPLPGGVNNTALSIQLGATSDSTISYTVQAGSTLPTGLTLSSGGLLSGTVTGLALETTYNFTVVATDVELQDSPKAFSITIVVSDQYFKNTVLLLQGDVTPFTADASTNKFELSAVGTPSANVNNPVQPGYYSGYFNGSGDYLSVPNINFSTNAFTIEGWFYPLSLATATNFWGTDNGSGSSPKMLMYINGSAQLTIDFGTAGTTQFPIAASISTYGLNTYQWNHIALVRSDLTATGLKLYINGILAGTGQVGTNLSTITAIFNVGYIGEAYGTKFNGYISNTRVINGVAVYTGAFTPPTVPLAATQSVGFLAATATPTVDVLVVAGGGGAAVGGGGAGGFRTASSFSVASGVAITVTVGAGGAGVYESIGIAGSNSVFSTITSYGGGYGGYYTGSVNGGPGGSGGGGGHLSGGTGGAATPVTSPVQGYKGGNSSSLGGAGGGGASMQGTDSVTNDGAKGGDGLSSSISGTLNYYAGGGGGGGGLNAGIPGAGGNGGGGSGAITTPGVSGTVNTGGGGGGRGYMAAGTGGAGGSGIVVLRYSSSYSPAASTTGNPSVVVAGGYRIYTWTTSGTITFGDSNIAAIAGTATSLLTCQSNRFIDNSSTPQTITASGTPSISVTQPFTLPSPYTGYGSMYFNGSSYLSAPSSAALGFSTGDFTVEGWFYFTVSSSTYQRPWFFGDDNDNAEIYSNVFHISGASQSILITGSTTILTNTWYHIALTRVSGSYKLWLNGTQEGSTATNSYNSSARTFTAMATSSGVQPSTGYVSNLRIVKGTAVYTGAFTPPTAPLTAISGTSLLTLQNNQAQNNNQFRDSSTNNFAVTRTGTPTQGTFTPFSQTGWSGYLSSQQYLTTPANSTFDITGADFTVEFWVYFTAYNTMASSGATAIGNFVSSNGWLIGFNGIGGLTSMSFNTYNSGSLIVAITATGITSTNLPLNSWHHTAWVQRGANLYFFLDGVSYNTTTAPSAVGAGGLLAIGVYIQNMSYSGNPAWYFSNMRIVKGVAVYTGNFTPPTAPLTVTQSAGTNIAAITGTATSLLAFNRNRFIDTIATPNTITVSGTPSIQAFSPFAPSAAYSATTVGGSVYFPGSSNLLVPSNASLALGTGDFTIEMWVYNTSTTNRLISYATVNSPIIYINTSNYVQYDNYGSASLLTSSILTPLNSWNHIAIVRLSGTTKIYINGVQAASGADTNNWVQDGIYIGTDVATTFMTGYLSNVRIVKGTAVYTGAFTPPTAPLTATQTSGTNIAAITSGTSLLMSATNSGILDATGKNDLTTVGDARTSTAVIKYGSSSMYFDGTGDWLSVPSSPNMAFGTGDFTVECWAYWSATASTGKGIVNLQSSGTFNFYWDGGSYLTNYFVISNRSVNQLTYSFSPTINTWYHLAVSRSGLTMRLFINGVLATSVTDSTNYGQGIASIGGDAANAWSWNGYLDDLRITKGIARYTTTFTPPSQAMLGM